MKIKEFLKEKLNIKPKKYFSYRMLCRKCDFIFENMDIRERACPICGSYLEVYDAEPIEEKIYDHRA